MFVCSTVPSPHVSVTILKKLTVGSELSLRCDVVSVRGINSGIDIVWMRNGTAIEKTDDNRMSISSTTISSNIHSSILQFLYLSENDESVYSCKATVCNSSNSKSVELKKFNCKL